MKYLSFLNKIFFLTVIYSCCFFIETKAQRAIELPENIIKSENWDYINTLNYKKDKDDKLVPLFSKELKDLENKEIELQGYIIPFESENKISNFAFSVLPIDKYWYCGKNNIPPLIEVIMNEPIKYTSNSIYVKGTVKLNSDNINHLEIILENCSLINY